MSNQSRNTKTAHDVPFKPAPVAPKPCSTCCWSVREGNGLSRCHANPPQVRLPYDNLAAWPVVPETGGGCRLWEERK